MESNLTKTAKIKMLFRRSNALLFKSKIRSATTIAILVTLIISFIYRTDLLLGLEWTSYDARFDFRGSILPGDQILIVDVDQDTYMDLDEKWPYPVNFHAKIVDRLTEAGAKVICFDFIFDLVSENPANDSTFAHSIKESGRVVLAEAFYRKIQNFMGDLLVNEESVRPNSVLREVGQPYLGFVSVPVDKDDLVRRAQIAYLTQREIESSVERHHYSANQLIPSLALRAIMIANGWQDEPILVDSQENTLRINQLTIPIQGSGNILVNFYGPPQTFNTIPYREIYNDEDFAVKMAVDSTYFKDKIVLVGTSLEELHDLFWTPFIPKNQNVQRMPGVEIHANTLQTILDGSYITKPHLGIFFIYLVFLTFFSSYMTIILGPRKGFFLMIGTLAIINVFSFAIFIEANIWLDLVHPTFAILITFGSNIFYQYVTEEREKRYIRSAFAHYLNPSVVDQVANNPKALSLGGEKKVLTCMFSDIRGFTTLSESLDPHELTNFLNEYLTAMTDIILARNGTVDKYMGDAIMAFWGAPLPDPDHAYHCCQTCLEQMEKLHQMQTQWRAEGRHIIDIGIGVNTGEMTVGNMGSSQRFDYTILGDAVNLGSRLEGTNKDYGTNIIINETTHAIVKDRFITRQLDRIRVKGKLEPVEIYELIANVNEPLPRNHLQAYQVYDKAIAAYFNRDWETAIEDFQFVLKTFPDDGPSKRHLAQCLMYRENPPPADWDGVYVKTSK